MTRAEALALKQFKHLCNCGGYAYSMNGRDRANPHMSWCPQDAEYREWYEAMYSLKSMVEVARESTNAKSQSGISGGGGIVNPG